MAAHMAPAKVIAQYLTSTEQTKEAEQVEADITCGTEGRHLEIIGRRRGQQVSDQLGEL